MTAATRLLISDLLADIRIKIAAEIESFVSTRDYDPDRQRAEDRKLKKLVKCEAKGVAHELRKDNYFLAEAKARDKARLDAEKEENMGELQLFFKNKSMHSNLDNLARA
ncbi:Nucleolar protein 14 [Artemisia annua]|uniref:Nucleolar protein 14 n=1 Tax=Artemisia annua TaxID=35608 RepID=A0A2U1M3X4_ARTAN|nr:Nucleolar protein 14 [Artemisia annua]